MMVMVIVIDVFIVIDMVVMVAMVIVMIPIVMIPVIVVIVMTAGQADQRCKPDRNRQSGREKCQLLHGRCPVVCVSSLDGSHRLPYLTSYVYRWDRGTGNMVTVYCVEGLLPAWSAKLTKPRSEGEAFSLLTVMHSLRALVESQIGVGDDSGLCCPRIEGCTSEARFECWGDSIATEYLTQATSPCAHVTHGAIKRRVGADFAKDGDVAGQDNRTAGEGLDQGQAETFGLAGHKKRAAFSVEFGDHLARLVGELDHARADG
jgi:hypothetical protein